MFTPSRAKGAHYKGFGVYKKCAGCEGYKRLVRIGYKRLVRITIDGNPTIFSACYDGVRYGVGERKKRSSLGRCLGAAKKRH